jgi:predicted dehydrogenase
MTKKRKVAIIGCGAVTQLNYVKELPRVPNVKVAYVYDLNEKLAKSVADSFDARVAAPQEIRERADAVIIATPPSTHKEIVTYYAERVPIIVCEKPFVGRKKDALDLVALARKKKVSLYVAHFRRCFPQVELARNLIGSGALGSIRGLYVYEGGRFSWPTESEYVSKDIYGGVLYDTGSHTLDMALYAAGLDDGSFGVKVRNVQRDRPEPSHEMKARFSFTSRKGNGIGEVYFSRYKALANKVRIVLDRGTVEIPVGLSDRIRLTGKSGSSLLFTATTYKDLMECFRLQYHYIFNTEMRSQFEATRFVNLSGMLETLATAKAKN